MEQEKKEGRTEENYWMEKGRTKLREGKEPNKCMRRGKEGWNFEVRHPRCVIQIS